MSSPLQASGNTGRAGGYSGEVAEDETNAEKKSRLGLRPDCFRTTFQEVLFTFIATMSVGTSAFVIGGVIVISNFVSQDLHMVRSANTPKCWLR